MSSAGGVHDGFSNLIGGLYDAAADARLWTGMAGRIAAEFDSSSAVLKLSGGDGGVDLLDVTDNLVVAERDRAWAEHWHRHDLWVERSVAAGLSRVVASHDLVARGETRHSPFYQDWLRHLDIHHMVGVTFAVDAGRIGVLGIHRPQGAGRYAETERRKVALLLPHLQRALRLGRILARTSLVETAALDALDRIDRGVLVLDGSRRIVHANALAETMLRDAREIGMLKGCLMARHPALNARLAERVRDAVASACGDPAPAQSFLAIPRDGRLPLTLAVAPLSPAWSRRDGQPPLALVVLRDPERPTIVARQLRDLFGLTPAEAALAAELARGRSLAEIAAAQGVGIATVRTHLKRILAKTGTRRQAEAVALIAHGVAATVDRQ